VTFRRIARISAAAAGADDAAVVAALEEWVRLDWEPWSTQELLALRAQVHATAPATPYPPPPSPPPSGGGGWEGGETGLIGTAVCWVFGSWALGFEVVPPGSPPTYACSPPPPLLARSRCRSRWNVAGVPTRPAGCVEARHGRVRGSPAAVARAAALTLFLGGAARQGEQGRAELEDRLLQRLEFGTAGLRGVMAAGFNRLNHLRRDTISDEKVANRDIRVARRDRKWSLNDGQIQNPSARL
jgi:hypothetical protein